MARVICRILLLGGLALLVSCGPTTLQVASARDIGCRADGVQIADDHLGWTTRDWIATCDGRRYRCMTTKKYAADTSCQPLPP
jgi:hypothetical protein